MDYNDNEIAELISNGVSYEEIGRKYGVTGNAIKKHAKKVGIPIVERRKKNPQETFNKGLALKEKHLCLNCGKEIVGKYYNKFCDSDCFQEYEYKKRVSEWQTNPEKYNKEDTPPFIRKYMFMKAECKCEICGWAEENPYTKNIPLELHHKDGDCTNNREENLQVLCPNHHSLTNTFGSLNKGNSKRYKLKEYKKKIRK